MDKSGEYLADVGLRWLCIFCAELGLARFRTSHLRAYSLILLLKRNALSWRLRAQCVKKLVDEGFGKKIFLSNDWHFGISIAPTGFMKDKEQTNPGGILFATRKVISYLRQIGVRDEQIRMITVERIHGAFLVD